MSPRRAGLTRAQHIDLGATLQRVRNDLMEAASAINCSYPRAAQVARRAQTALRAVDQLRSALDDMSAREIPEADWSPLIYYGANRELRNQWLAEHPVEASGPEWGVRAGDGHVTAFINESFARMHVRDGLTLVTRDSPDRNAAEDYEERWVSAEPGRVVRLRCRGFRFEHAGYGDCSEPACPGTSARHTDSVPCTARVMPGDGGQVGRSVSFHPTAAIDPRELRAPSRCDTPNCRGAAVNPSLLTSDEGV